MIPILDYHPIPDDAKARIRAFAAEQIPLAVFAFSFVYVAQSVPFAMLAWKFAMAMMYISCLALPYVALLLLASRKWLPLWLLRRVPGLGMIIPAGAVLFGIALFVA